MSGPGGQATALVTSGATGDCAVSLTNVWGSISLLCRTGASGPARGVAVGGDSGPALVMLSAPSAPSGPHPTAGSTATASPFAALSPGGREAGPARVAASAGAPATGRPGGLRSVRTPSSPDAARRRVLVAAGLSLGPARADVTAAVASAPVFLPLTGLGSTVPLSLAAGLMLTGGLGAAATTRRRRRLGRD